ncbi:Coq4 family protein [Phenylobacterium sp.]|jgi:ubiquinone biosynthesis protein Coq4|uniref:Coq4 family protein n=1 Tax=Phenylobacterium sp. TaxID=1871053 RepID=UPI0037C95DAF
MTRASFEAATARADGDAFALAADLRREATTGGLQGLAALWMSAAISQPERLSEIYDRSAEGWRGEAVKAAALAGAPALPEPIPPEFWTAFWALIDTPPGTLGAGGVTQRTAALLGHLSPGMTARVARTALAYPGCAEAAAQGYPAKFTMASLAVCPKVSLGGEFHSLIVDNGFDLEVLDRETLGLADLPAPLDYLNARILQCHDLWHLAAGYQTTGLHEVAISGFQLGQFGHSYSAMFLAMVLTRAAFDRPEAATLLLDTILGGWVHGRESPPLLGVAWEAIWDQPMDAVRAGLGLKPYTSAWPADLFEQLAVAA